MHRSHRTEKRSSVRSMDKRPKLGAIEQLESRCLLSVRVVARYWTITGDDNPQSPDDQILIDRDPSNAAHLRVTVSGVVEDTRPERRVRGIRIAAGAGSDTVTIDESGGPILAGVTAYGGAGDDEIEGASGRDLLDGGPGRDSLDGGDGNDRLRGGADPNRLEGGAGDDSLTGGSENDTIWGGDGDDRIDGAAGRDRLQGGIGRDRIQGGADNDTLIGHGDDPVSDDAGFARATAAVDEETVDDESDDDMLDGGPGDNVLVGGGGSDVLQNGRPPESLEHIESCDDVAQRLMEQAQQQYNWYFDGGWGRPGGGIVLPLDSVLTERFLDVASVGNFGGAGGAPESDSTFSGTNTQELGVDEADIVKTDGSSIFILRNGEFIIVDAVPAADASVISRTEIEGYAIDMFLRGDRAMVFSSVFIPFEGEEPWPDPTLIDDTGGELVRIASPFWLPRGTSVVKVTVLDVSDPSAPSVVHESILDGDYINSRMIDGQVYVVLSNSPRFPQPIILRASGGDEVESPQAFEERLAATDPRSFLPQFRSVDYTESGVVERTGNLLVDCGDLYKTPTDDFLNLTTVLSFDLDAATIGGPADSATVFGYVNTVYASAQNLYLIQETYHTGESVSGIHQIALGDDIQVVASGEVPGHVLNQFSLDEEGDFFRVATTTQGFDGNQFHTENNVFVLAAEGDTLNVVGSLEDLAPGETIHSARFFADEGFVVTFRRIDPLFALDLSDPTDPQVAGVLKIPGYSSYLHPVGEDHLLAIGRDADENGRVRGLQVSLFDVSDLSAPTLADQFLIQPAGEWSWSAAEWDHHAFGFFPEFGVLSIPVSGSVMIPAVDDGDPNTFDFPIWQFQSEFWVFQVDLSSGFDLLGQVEHDSPALRSLRISNVLYTLAQDNLKAQPILTPAATTADVSLGASP